MARPGATTELSLSVVQPDNLARGIACKGDLVRGPRRRGYKQGTCPITSGPLFDFRLSRKTRRNGLLLAGAAKTANRLEDNHVPGWLNKGWADDSTSEATPPASAEGDANSKGRAVNPEAHQPREPIKSAKDCSKIVRGSCCQLRGGLLGARWPKSAAMENHLGEGHLSYLRKDMLNGLKIIDFRQDMQLQIRRFFAGPPSTIADPREAGVLRGQGAAPVRNDSPCRHAHLAAWR